MWYTAFKKEHIRIQWWYNLLIKIKKGKKKTLQHVSGGKRRAVPCHWKYGLDLTPFLAGKARGDFPNIRPGCWAVADHDCCRQFCGSDCPRRTPKTDLAARLSILVCHLICHRHGIGLLYSATSSMVAKHSQPNQDTVGSKGKGVTMPGVLWQRGGDSGRHMVAQEHRATFSQQPREVPGSHILHLLFCKN